MANGKLYGEKEVGLILELLSSENAQGFLKGMGLAGQLKIEEVIGKLEGIVMCPPPVATGVREMDTNVLVPVLSADNSVGWEYEPVRKTVRVYLPSIVIQEAAIDTLKLIGGKRAEAALKRIRENNKDCRIALKLLGSGIIGGGKPAATRQIE